MERIQTMVNLSNQEKTNVRKCLYEMNRLTDKLLLCYSSYLVRRDTKETIKVVAKRLATLRIHQLPT
jgi:hypothetical protein